MRARLSRMLDCNVRIGGVSFFASCLIALSIAGCSAAKPKTPPTFPVTGTVMYQGKPLDSGTVTFYPADGMPASGPLTSGGKFTLTTYETGDGAIKGHHKVVIRAFNSGASVGTGNTASESLVPKVYNDMATTPLAVEVTEKPNKFDLELKDK